MRVGERARECASVYVCVCVRVFFSVPFRFVLFSSLGFFFFSFPPFFWPASPPDLFGSSANGRSVGRRDAGGARAPGRRRAPRVGVEGQRRAVGTDEPHDAAPFSSMFDTGCDRVVCEKFLSVPPSSPVRALPTSVHRTTAAILIIFNYYYHCCVIDIVILSVSHTRRQRY